MLETHPPSALEDLRRVTVLKRCWVMPGLRKAEVAGNPFGVDMDQQLLRKAADGDRLPDVRLLLIPLPHVPLTAAHPDVCEGKD